MTKKVIAIAADIECSNLYDMVGGDLLSMGLVEVLEDYTLGREICRDSQATSANYFDDQAARVHGFSYWKAMTFPHRKVGMIDVLDWLAEIKTTAPLPFLYYAQGKFDWRWIFEHLSKEDLQYPFSKILPEALMESVLKLARSNLKHIKESIKINPITNKLYGKYTLRNVSDHYNLILNHHNSLSDARACGQIYCNIKKGIDVWTGTFL